MPAEPSTATTAVKIKYEANSAVGGGGGGGEVLIGSVGDRGGGHAATLIVGDGKEKGPPACKACGGILCECQPFADSR